jgi:hypothetical protein
MNLPGSTYQHSSRTDLIGTGLYWIPKATSGHCLPSKTRGTIASRSNQKTPRILSGSLDITNACSVCLFEPKLRAMTVKPYQEPPADTSDLPKRLGGTVTRQPVRAIATEARQSSTAKKFFCGRPCRGSRRLQLAYSQASGCGSEL